MSKFKRKMQREKQPHLKKSRRKLNRFVKQMKAKREKEINL